MCHLFYTCFRNSLIRHLLCLSVSINARIFTQSRQRSAMAVIIQHLASILSVSLTDASGLETSIPALKSSIVALESYIKTLEGSSGRWETLAWSCAFAVGIGIVGEIVVIVGEHQDGVGAWRRGIVLPPDHPDVRRFWFDIVATLLVLIGVFGEAAASMQLASINSQLRSKTSELRAKSDQLVALVTQEAGGAAANARQAQDSAGAARTAAGTARGKADAASIASGKAQHSADSVANQAAQLRTSIDKATADIRLAESAAASARAENLATEQTLERERNTRLELEKSIAPRGLWLMRYADGTSNIDELKKWRGTVVSIRYIPDFEAERAARFIASVLDQSGWKISGVDSTKDFVFDGVQVE
jgi:hypothetical protein